jgi:hypothetical protein
MSRKKITLNEFKTLVKEIIKEEIKPNNEKRYVATVEFYVWGDNDEDVIKQVQEYCTEQDLKNDNHCNLISLVEQPLGKIGNRVVISNSSK